MLANEIVLNYLICGQLRLNHLRSFRWSKKEYLYHSRVFSILGNHDLNIKKTSLWFVAKIGRISGFSITSDQDFIIFFSRNLVIFQILKIARGDWGRLKNWRNNDFRFSWYINKISWAQVNWWSNRDHRGGNPSAQKSPLNVKSETWIFSSRQKTGKVHFGSTSET